MDAELTLKVASGIIATIALAFSIFSFRNSRIAIRLTVKSNYMTALFEIDKQMIANPTLWAIYDSKKDLLKEPDDKNEKVKRRSFISYHFNLFEVTHSNYTQIANVADSDKEFWESMLKYIKQFLRDSSEARDFIKEPDNRELYLPAFVNLIDSIIAEIEKQIPKN